MKKKILSMKVLTNEMSVIRLEKNEAIPNWSVESEFFSITKTDDELSIVCDSEVVPQDSNFVREDDWRALKVLGPLDFSLVGILSKISKVLADESISIFAISTYDTDYILVKENDLAKAISALEKNDYDILK